MNGSGLERLKDLLERATPGPWRWGHCGDEYCDCSWLDSEETRVMFLSTSVDDVTPDSDDRALIALAPVLAVDLIALAEAVTAVIARDSNLADYGLWPEDAALAEALSTLLVHIDDSLGGDSDPDHRLASARREVGADTDRPLEGVSE